MDNDKNTKEQQYFSIKDQTQMLSINQWWIIPLQENFPGKECDD